MDSFAGRLAAGIRRSKTPTLVGLDPRFESLPEPLTTGLSKNNPVEVASAFEAFCKGVIDVVAPLVAVVKPQAAFFEQVGVPGMAALAETIAYAREKGLLVILDAKRNDIGSTAAAYADAYLGPPETSAWGADALTVSPYLGEDSLTPFVEVAEQRGAGIFVLVKTSNPGGGLFQDIKDDGGAVYQHVARHVESLNATNVGASGYGSIGAVVGATYPEQLSELRSVMPHAWFLVPGFGAQGGTAADVAGAFDANGLGAIVNNSRGIIFAHDKARYKDRFGATNWQAAVEAATRDMIESLRAETPAGRLA
ncbi:MAG: orotidine-5'-phosphate decarboxylase [Planctomycetota bacterium]|nr:orotidine-5'-phosphate decarboxylase [Planctomycetota bacterium]